MNTDGNLATAARRGQSHALDGDGKTGIRIVEKGDGCDGSRIIFSRLDSERTLPRSRTKIFRLQSLPYPFSLFQPVQSGSGQQYRIGVPLSQLAQARIHIPSKLNRLNIRPQRLQLSTPPTAAGSHTRARWQLGQVRKIDRHKHVARIGP